MLIDHLGGRKSVLGYLFLVSTTFLTSLTLRMEKPDLVGLSVVIGAIATGVFGLVWGNVKEHQAAQKINGV